MNDTSQQPQQDILLTPEQKRELEDRRLTKSGNPQSGLVDTNQTQCEED